MAWSGRLIISSLRHHCSTRKFGTNAGNKGRGGESEAPGCTRPVDRHPILYVGGESLRNSMGDRATWDTFYSGRSHGETSPFDWFFSYDFLRGFLLSMIGDVAPKGHAGPPLHLLDVGCGTSDVGLCLFCDSPVPVIVSCIDRSEPAVRTMKERFTKGLPVTPQHPDSRLEYIQADATDLHMFPTASVSLVLDKGTSDALLRSGKKEAYSMVREAFRVLCPYGKLVQITDEDPDARFHFLEKAGAGTAVALQELGGKDGVLYYAYIVTPPPCTD